MRWGDRRGIYDRAKAAGEMYYFTGIACSKGHVAKRHVSNRCCSECVVLHNRAKRRFTLEEVRAERAKRTQQHVDQFSCERVQKAHEAAQTIISRMSAKASGLKTYFTGRPCKRGHVSSRLVSTKDCTSCSKERYLANKTEHLRKCAERYAANPGVVKARVSAYQKSNPDKARLFYHRRRARIAMVGGSFTQEDLLEIRRSQKNRCAYCKCTLNKSAPADHIIPVARGGSNHRFNIQLLCLPCNSKKGQRDPIEYSQSLGRLL